MKRALLLIATALLLFGVNAFSQATKRLVRILDTEKYYYDEDSQDEYDQISYSFGYDEQGRLTDITYLYDNYYSYLMFAYTKMAVIAERGSNDDGSFSRTIYQIGYSGKPAYSTAISYMQEWEENGLLEYWTNEGFELKYLYDDKEQLISVESYEEAPNKIVWRNGNLVSLHNGKTTLEYGSAQNKLGILCLAMPFILTGFDLPVDIKDFVVCGSTVKNLPVSITGKNYEDKVVKYKLTYTFDSDGYPTKVTVDNGKVYEFKYE